MRRAVSIQTPGVAGLFALVLTTACAVDHTGLLAPGQPSDTGPRRDAAVSDMGPGDPDIPMMPDVYDGGPDIPLPTDCTSHVAASGSDEAAGTSIAPLRTLDAALAMETPVICVAEGQFDGMVVVNRSVRIRGGYCDGFERLGCTTELRGPVNRVMRIQGLEEDRIRVELENLSLLTGSARGDGGSTYGIQAIDTDLVVRRSLIRAKDGAAGADVSEPGATGAAGEDGGDDGRRSGGDTCSQGGGGGGTGGGPSPGGDGEGASGDFGRGGAAGSGGNGNDGSAGESASGVGAPGAGGDGNWSLSPDGEFRPSDGGLGGEGPPGGGGGGGGAGNFGFNNVGGGGGGGGCGGGGGLGGGGGGGSFGIVAIRSSVVLGPDVVITLGRGGDGGAGGVGGEGGPGGSGRGGGSAISGQGGDGGDGGRGGRGGPGGGGQGGPAIAVLLGESSLDGNPGESGEGGAGGRGGMMGMPGAVGGQLSLEIRD